MTCCEIWFLTLFKLLKLRTLGNRTQENNLHLREKKQVKNNSISKKGTLNFKQFDKYYSGNQTYEEIMNWT
jgi:hypothetical protein